MSAPVKAKTNVLIVTDSFAVGGAEQVAVDVANTLDRTRHRVWFCATRGGGPMIDRLEPDVEAVVLGRRATWDLIGLARFAALVNRAKIDVIHSHGRGTMQFVALARVLGLIRARHVFHDHFGWLNLDRSASRPLRIALDRGVDAYLGVDSRLCSWAVTTAGIDASRVFLVRSGVDLTRFDGVEPEDVRAQLGLTDQILLAMVANIRQPKDHPTLLLAIAALPLEVRDRLHIALVGATGVDPVYEDGCRAMIDRLGIEPWVSFLGPARRPASILASVDGGILTTKNETGPLVVLEYMASSKTFIASDTGEITHAVRDLGVGFVVPPRDPDALAAALRAFVDLSPEERSAMGQRCHQVVEEQFEQQIVTRSIEEVYALVTGHGHPTNRAGSGTDASSSGSRARA